MPSSRSSSTSTAPSLPDLPSPMNFGRFALEKITTESIVFQSQAGQLEADTFLSWMDHLAPETVDEIEEILHNERGETTVPGLYAAGDIAFVPHGYMLGAFTSGKLCGRNAAEFIDSVGDSRLDDGQIRAEQKRALRPLSQPRLFDVPDVVDEERCIKGCHICVESCPVDCLAIAPATGKSHMKYDDCWYCLACEVDCPKNAITVKIPYLIR
jgi:NAD-dependent dihydropyrimidine dehydrogenase PreA subunit